MDVKAGAEDTYLVSSTGGRLVATFTQETTAREWIEQRKAKGVNYRLFVRKSDTTELT